MANLSTTLKVELTDEFKQTIEQAKDDFRQLHTELTDDIKKLISEEVARQLKELEQRMRMNFKTRGDF